MHYSIVVLVAALAAGPVTAHDPFNDPAYPGIQAQEEGKAPKLPDYTKAPFTKLDWPEQGPTVVSDYPQLGPLTITVYATAKRATSGQRAVSVYTDAAKVLKYAELHEVSEDGTLYIVFRYLYVDSAWVFKGMAISPHGPKSDSPK